jgi:hypothetical protein
MRPACAHEDLAFESDLDLDTSIRRLVAQSLSCGHCDGWATKS